MTNELRQSCHQLPTPELLACVGLNRKEQFARCLIEKMVSYSIGRPLTIRDRPDIDQLVDRMKKTGGGLQDLVLSVVASDTFLSR